MPEQMQDTFARIAVDCEGSVRNCGHDPRDCYADPLQAVDFCRWLKRWEVLGHDYHLRDFTICLYKPART